MKTLALLFLFLFVFPVVCMTSKTVQATTDGSELVNGTYSVPLRSIRYVRVYIDASGKAGMSVSGSVMSNGNEIYLYVFDEDGYYRYSQWEAQCELNGGFSLPPFTTLKQYFQQEFSAYVCMYGNNSYEYSFVPSQTDHYYFVFDNYWQNDWQTNKVIQLTATWTDAGTPEFSSFMIMSLFMIATMLAVTFYKKARPRQKS